MKKSASEWEEYIYKNLDNQIVRKLDHCPMASLQSIKEKKSKQTIDIDYIGNSKTKLVPRVIFEIFALKRIKYMSRFELKID